MKKNRCSAFSLIELSIVILIIGILVAGITQASRLVTKMRLTSARTFTQSAPLASIKNLVLWYDTVSSASFDSADEEDGSVVTNWYDINPTSVNKINASSSSTKRPSYKEKCINGLPCLNFDGVDDYMDTSNIGVTSTAVTYFIVVNPTTIANAGLIMTPGWSAGSNSLHFQISSSGKFAFHAINGSSISSSDNLAANLPYILSVVDNFSDVTLYKNAANVGSVTTSANKTLGVLNIGCYSDGASYRDRFLSGYIGEVIVFDRALKVEERKSIESYLSKKWKINI